MTFILTAVQATKTTVCTKLTTTLNLGIAYHAVRSAVLSLRTTNEGSYFRITTNEPSAGSWWCTHKGNRTQRLRCLAHLFLQEEPLTSHTHQVLSIDFIRHS